jgi:hypothetical protein
MESFDYIIDKINATAFTETPFKHLSIESIFSEEHFKEIISASQINLPKFGSDRELIDGLKSEGYEVIHFPGTTTDEKKYIKWHESKGSAKHTNQDTCEGVGLTVRLKKVKSSILTDVNEFFASQKLKDTLCEKFKLNETVQSYEGGIQKYLDGYEISPHPDIRRKSLTWMININSVNDSEHLKIHTDYLVFKKQFEYVKNFWEYNNDYERCWVPWNWTETINSQTKNNSIVIFAPSNDTLHAVKLDYDHLPGQRTQIYGNLWSTEGKRYKDYNWQDLTVEAREKSRSLKDRLKSGLPPSLKEKLKTFVK